MGEESGFVLAGLSACVRNDDPAAIGALWEAFRGRDVRTEIDAEASPQIYCVYHDYEGGVSEPYRMTIGFRVPHAAKIPDSLYRVNVPDQTFVTYRTEGPQPQTLIAQWQAIWEGELNRAYVADYDVYDADNPDCVTVHVGVAEA